MTESMDQIKVAFIGDPARTKKYLPDTEFARSAKIVTIPVGATEDEVISKAEGAVAIVVDAISKVTRREMESLPTLKIVESEGAAYDKIDVEAAEELGIYVCNQKGANAKAVAEHTVMLMLALLRSLAPGYESVLAGRQIETKMRLMVSGIRELSEVKVGLVGFGAIAKETARLLVPFASETAYYSRTRADAGAEERYGVSYEPLFDLLSSCDIISMHVPVTPQTEGMCGGEFFDAMKDGSYFVNTARGDLVDNEALASALISGKLAGAGLDTVAPEPVTADNVLVNLPPEVQSRVIITPHIAGVTSGFFARAHRAIWENIESVVNGMEPRNRVV